MLTSLRERFTGRFALVILALICLPFLFFGVPNDFIASENVASVNDVEISQPFFENQYQNEMLRYDSEGIEIPDEARIFVRQNVLNTIINDVLTESYIEDQGINISDEFVAKVIQTSPEFMVNGVFSKDIYYTWLNERVIEPSDFEAVQRRNIRKSQLERAVRATSFVTPSEYRRYLNLVGEQRKVAIAEIDLSVLAEPIELLDDDIEEYYSSRSDEFLEPESIDFKYIELRRDQLNTNISISEDEIRQYYEDSGSRFAQDERRQASHILILFGEDELVSEEKAIEALQKINNGDDFSEIVLEYSEDDGTKQFGGDLGMLAKSQLPGALGDAIFSMDLNQISNIVRTDFGFHIIKLYDIQSDGKIQFDLVKNELEQELSEQRSNESFLDNERELADALFDAGNIEELAKDLEFPIQSEMNFTSQGGGSFGSNQLVIDAIFDAQRSADQDISDIIEVDSTRSIVFQIQKYNESQIKPLSEVRDTIISDMKIVSAEILANDIAKRLEDQFRNRGNIEETVNGLDSVTLRNVLMNRASDDEDFMLQASVFGEKRPQEGQFQIGTVIMSNSNYAVYSVDESVNGVPETIPQEERDEARNQLNQQSGFSDYAALISELAMRAEISRNEEIISSSSLFD